MLIFGQHVERDAAEEGFTLVELLVSIAVLGVVMLGLSAVMFGALSTNVQTKIRIDETRDEQIAAVYFGVDAQSATSITSTGTARCGPGSAVVEFQGTSYDPVTYEERITVVSYVFSTATVDGGPAGQLRRQTCETPAAPPPTYPLAIGSTTTVARVLSTTPPNVVCLPAYCGPNATSVILRAQRRSGDAPFELVGTRRTTP